MKQRIYKVFCGIVILCTIAMLTINDNIVYAASATVSISTSNVTQGNEFEVTITVTSDEKMAGYTFMLEYDSEIIEVVSGHDGGGGGQISVADAFAPGVNEFTKVIVFKAKKPGTTSIKYTCLDESWGILNDSDLSNMAVTAKDGSVTVKAPVVASSNNNLSSLTVAAVRGDGSSYNVNLTPGFSKDVTTYNLQVEEGVTDLAITAKAEDAKASVKVQWANLDPGDNTTKIIVTAENGSTKQYNIYTKVPIQETSTPAPEEPITVDIGGVQHYIENVNDAVALPEGFETVEYDYNGKTVLVGKGLNKNLIVMYITSGDGSTGNLYIYDEEKNSFYQMVNIEITQKLYTIVDAPEDLVVPAGFDEYTVNIDGTSFQGWKNDEIESVYLVYAMNWNGESGLYFYDEVEKQMIKYFDTSVEAGASIDAYNDLLAENEKLKEDIANLQNGKGTGNNNGENEKTNLYIYIAIGCGVAVVILIGVIIVLLTKDKKEETDTDDSDLETDKEEITEEGVTEEDVTEEIATEEDVQKVEEAVEEAAEEVPEEITEATEEIEENVAEAMPETAEEMAHSDNEENGIEKKTHDVTELFKDVLFGGKVSEENSEINEEETIENAEDEVADEVAEDEETDEVTEDEVTEDEATDKVTDDKVRDNLADDAVEDDMEMMAEIEELLQLAASETIMNAEVSEEIVPEKPMTDDITVAEPEKAVSTEEEATEEEVVEEDKKKRVEKILNDEETSIKSEDIDLVIDELFDELFDE